MSVPEARTWRPAATRAVRLVSAGITAGFVVGLVVGGIGGRLAMFALRLTSDPSLIGVETDDGFTIGAVTSGTAFLVVLATIVGVWTGFVYVGVRGWFPRRVRPWVFGTLAAAIGGALVIRPDGIDFTALEPRSLAVAMFVAIPAGYGIAIPLLADRLIDGRSAFMRSRAWIAGLIVATPVLVIVPPAAAVVAGVVLAIAIGRERVVALWSSPGAAWVGRATIAGLATLGGIALVRDVAQIL